MQYLPKVGFKVQNESTTKRLTKIIPPEEKRWGVGGV